MKLYYSIPECNLDILKGRIEALNKQAKKLGLPDIILSVDGVDYSEHLMKSSKTGSIFWTRSDRIDPTYQKMLGPVRNWFSVTIDGVTPKFEGWTFVAILEPVPGADKTSNMIRKVPGVEQTIPLSFRDRVGECDHCNTNRYRKETYIVFHDEQGFKMVGSSCIKDFLGYNDPHGIAKYLELLQQCNTVCGNTDEEFWGTSGCYTYEPLIVLAQTLGVIRQYGWKSKKQAYEDYGIATADKVLACLLPPNKQSLEEKKMMDKTVPTTDDNVKAKKILDWLASLDSDSSNDYLYNLSLLGQARFVTLKQFGVLCSSVVAYDRALAAKENKTSSDFVGAIKDRIEITVTVNRIFIKEGDFGTTRIHHMTDDNGNYLVWFASNNGLVEGETYKVKATIKDHSVYNGTKQTIVNRVSPVE